MKHFACGAVVPGCTATFKGATEEDVLGKVAVHAKEVHGIDEPPPELITQVREKMHDVPA